MSWNQSNTAVTIHLIFFSQPALWTQEPQEPNSNTLLYVHQQRKTSGHGSKSITAGQSPWAVLLYLHVHEWLLSQQYKGSIALLERGLLLERNNTLIFPPYVEYSIIQCTVVIISTAIWIRSCCIWNRKHPSHELKGKNDVTLQNMCRNQISTKEINTVAAMMNPWHS